MRDLLTVTGLVLLTGFAAVLAGAPLLAAWTVVAGGLAAARHDDGYKP